MAKIYGFKNPMPVMCSTRESGGLEHMFKAGDNFYIWNEIEDDIWKITYPTRLNDILSAMNTEGWKTITVELVEIMD